MNQFSSEFWNICCHECFDLFCLFFIFINEMKNQLLTLRDDNIIPSSTIGLPKAAQFCMTDLSSCFQLCVARVG